MTRILVLGGLTLAVLVAVWGALTHAPEPPTARTSPADSPPDAASHAVAPPPAPPHLDVPRATDVPVPPATASIHGRVTEHGRPVAGFPVELRHSAPHTVTDDDGTFRLDGPAIGTRHAAGENLIARLAHKVSFSTVPPRAAMRHVAIADDDACGRDVCGARCSG